MAVSRLSQTSLQNAFQKYNTIWDGRSAVGGMDAIWGITLTSNQTSVSFNNIPQTYSYLQLRVCARTNRSTYNIDGLRIQFNNDSSSRYSYHNISADPSTAGTAVATAGGASQTNILIGQIGTTVSTNTYGIAVADILDYANTNKFTTSRSLAGVETNGGAAGYSGYHGLYGGCWLNADPVTSITLFTDTSSAFQANSSFTLYGVK